MSLSKATELADPLTELSAYGKLAEQINRLAANLAVMLDPLVAIVNEPINKCKDIPGRDDKSADPRQQIKTENDWDYWWDWTMRAGELFKEYGSSVSLKKIELSDELSQRTAAKLLQLAMELNRAELTNAWSHIRENAAVFQTLNNDLYKVASELLQVFRRPLERDFVRNIQAACIEVGLPTDAVTHSAYRLKLSLRAKQFTMHLQFGPASQAGECQGQSSSDGQFSPDDDLKANLFSNLVNAVCEASMLWNYARYQSSKPLTDAQVGQSGERVKVEYRRFVRALGKIPPAIREKLTAFRVVRFIDDIDQTIQNHAHSPPQWLNDWVVVGPKLSEIPGLETDSLGLSRLCQEACDWLLVNELDGVSPSNDQVDQPKSAHRPGILSAPQIAQTFQLPYRALEIALRRHAKKHPDCVTHPHDRRPTECFNLYRLNEVMPVIEKQRGRASKKSVAQNVARKKLVP